MNKIFLMEFGSHVYGTNLPSSDRDYKGLFLPSAADIIEVGLSNLEYAQSVSTLPKEPNYALAQDFIFNTYLDLIKKSVDN